MNLLPDTRQTSWSAIDVPEGAALTSLKAEVAGSPLYNPDLAPVGAAERTWNTWNITALWISMSAVLTTYTLASGFSGCCKWLSLFCLSSYHTGFRGGGSAGPRRNRRAPSFFDQIYVYGWFWTFSVAYGELQYFLGNVGIRSGKSEPIREGVAHD